MAVEYRIREAKRQDAAVISRLWRELIRYHQERDSRFRPATDGERQYLRHTQEMIRSRDARVLVAEDALTGVVVGYLMGEMQHRPPISLPGLYGFVSDMYVCEAWRKRGVGRALYQDMEGWFRERKAEAVQLYAAPANPSALGFWEEMGLTPFLSLMHKPL